MDRIAAVDVGGTFTDVAMWDSATRTVHTHKLLTSAGQNPTRAIIEGLEGVGAAADLVVHGTTLVTNALIERRGAVVGLITTDGYRDVLEIADELRYDTFDLGIRRPDPLVARALRLSVRERTGAGGESIVDVDLAAVVAAGHRLVAAGAEAIVVAFLNSYANPEHEKRAADALAKALAGTTVCASADVSGEVGEYARFSTAAASAFVQPLVSRYLSEVRDEIAGRLMLMVSDGSIATAAEATRRPIKLVESGPAGGAIAVANLARTCNWPQVIAFDMGGTTAKLSLIHDGEPQIANQLEVARIHRLKKGSGLPVRVPTVELIEIGAGGGSIAHVDALGRFRVGPASAGADPGPACYDRGGRLPTVTDADLLLGRISPDGLVGGRLPLDAGRAEAALAELGSALGMDVTGAAAGVVAIVDTYMASAARMHFAEHGRDARQYRMVAFGGAGPLHACGVARRLGVREVVFPRDAGVASAIGMLQARRGVELVRTAIARLDRADWAGVRRAIREMELEARGLLGEAGVHKGDVVISHLADIRYVGQGYQLTVPLDAVAIANGDQSVISDAFSVEYRRRFGRSLDHMAVEIVSWRLRASGPPSLSAPLGTTQVSGGERRPHTSSRRAYFEETSGFSGVPVHQRQALDPETPLAGPILIDEPDTTIVVPPGWTAVLDRMGNVIAQRTG